MTIQSRIKSLVKVIKDHEENERVKKEKEKAERKKEKDIHLFWAIVCGLSLGWVLTIMVIIPIKPMETDASIVLAGAVIIMIGLYYFLKFAAQRFCGSWIGPIIFRAFYIPFFGSSVATIVIILRGGIFGF